MTGADSSTQRTRVGHVFTSFDIGGGFFVQLLHFQKKKVKVYRRNSTTEGAGEGEEGGGATWLLVGSANTIRQLKSIISDTT